MEEGNLRADVNVSLRPEGSDKLGTKVEMKNLNSFKVVEDSLEYEIERQNEVLEDGGILIQETRTWDDGRGITLSMRSKEKAQDYRYMPEPDLVPIVTTDEQIEEFRKQLPELPDARKARLVGEYGLPEYDAEIITATRAMAEYFDATVAAGADAKLASNWIMGELSKHLNAGEMTIENSPVSAQNLAALIALIGKGTISSKIAKKVFEEMWSSGNDPEKSLRKKALYRLLIRKLSKQSWTKPSLIIRKPYPIIRNPWAF